MPGNAYAACGASTGGGSGPPSISATEISTAQALQILRRRQDEALANGGFQLASATQISQAQTPATIAGVPGTQQPPAPAPAAAPPSPSAPAPSAQAPSAPKQTAPAAKKTTTLAKPAAPQYGGSVKDEPADVYSSGRGRGYWGQV